MKNVDDLWISIKKKQEISMNEWNDIGEINIIDVPVREFIYSYCEEFNYDFNKIWGNCEKIIKINENKNKERKKGTIILKTDKKKNEEIMRRATWEANTYGVFDEYILASIVQTEYEIKMSEKQIKKYQWHIKREAHFLKQKKQELKNIENDRK